MPTWITGLLGLPGVHFLVTRLGTERLRAASFDQKFRRGDWNFQPDPSAELVSVVARYASQGYILMLGCGSGSLAAALPPECFAGFVGVDISAEAIKRASKYVNSKIRFEVGDCTKFECDRSYDVILFSESLYYINPLCRKSLLRRLAANLSPTGLIVVTIADAVRYAGILRMIRSNFCVAEDRPFRSGDRHLIVFR